LTVSYVSYEVTTGARTAAKRPVLRLDSEIVHPTNYAARSIGWEVDGVANIGTDFDEKVSWSRPEVLL